jgi:FKBP-type peptidyl-prolyl cis-trans isomerase 2
MFMYIRISHLLSITLLAAALPVCPSAISAVKPGDGGGAAISVNAEPVAANSKALPNTTREEMLNGILRDAMAQGINGSMSVENFDKDLAAREAGNAHVAPTDKMAAAYGDLVIVDYQAMLEDGSLFLATQKEVAENQAQKKVSWYSVPNSYRPEAITVGKPARLPAIGGAVVGMKPGETKRLTLTPEQAFGLPDPRKRMQFPLAITLPRVVTLPAEEYVKRAGAFPVVGQELQLTPYFPARVTAVREKDVDLEFLVEDGKSFKEPFGATVVKMSDKGITTTLTPVIGSSFPLQGGSGIITSSDGKTFTVDQNHPLAGKTVVIDLTLNAVTQAVDLPVGDLPWQEEHDAGLAAARKSGRPAVMVLHADWCSYCKKLFSETMPDPRISSLRDQFTWIKVNSDKLSEYKKRYGQEGFPMIVLFRADGTLARTLDGYQDAAVLRAALQDVL